MTAAERVKAQIRRAFAVTRYPGDSKLRASDEGDEPFQVERAFRGKRHWRSLSPQFLDGWACALSFFSDAAFRFYLPAYLLADVDGRLEHSNPVFHLTHGLERSSAAERVNPRRYGNETWNDYARQRFARFTPRQAAAIVAYLTFKRDSSDPLDPARQNIDDALQSYWYERAA